MSTFNSPTDVVALTKVHASDLNNLDAAVAAAFSLLPTETNLTRGTVSYAVDTGVANAYVVALPHTPSGLVDGLTVRFRALNSNTGASTINPSSLGVVSIRDLAGAALAAGDITVGVPLEAVYSTSTGFFHLLKGGLRGPTGPTGNIITLGTPVATTSGTSVDFVGILSGTKQISINFYEVSTNGTNPLLVQLGDSGGVEITGYVGSSACIKNGISPDTGGFTSGFGLQTSAATDTINGSLVLRLENSINNTWVASGAVGPVGGAQVIVTSGSKLLSSALDRVRITTTLGTNAFDAGEINIAYM